MQFATRGRAYVCPAETGLLFLEKFCRFVCHKDSFRIQNRKKKYNKIFTVCNEINQFLRQFFK